MKKVLSIATAAAMAINIASVPFNVLAEELPNQNDAKTAIELEVDISYKTVVSKFSLYGKDLLNAYNEVFKMDNANIKAIENNGGRYSNSYLSYAIDENLTTHWETGKPNSENFTNEVVFTLNDLTELNRIVYAARPGGKGFAQEFEVYGSTTDEGDNFTFIAEGEYKKSVGDVIEIKFNPTQFKRLKFVFNKANQDWASAAEFSFYKEDALWDQMASLFTDSSKNEVSANYNTVEKLNQFENEVKSHPLYEQFKEDIQNAKSILNTQQIEASKAITKPFSHYENAQYSKLFRMDYANIQSISNNAGHYGSAVIGNAVDGKLDTYWETNKANTSAFSNEVEVTFKEAVTLDRVIYGARPSDRKGFAEEFEIYASQTSQGDTYQLVATGQHNMKAGLVEAKFQPTTFKRIKFKFKKSNQNWATIAELAFYKEDGLTNKINDLFTNGLMNELKQEYNSVRVINQLEIEAANHPLRDRLQVNLNIAKDIVNNVNISNEAIITATQRGDANSQARKYQIARTTYSLDTFGRYVTPGETIQVFVDADVKGEMPTLVLGQIADDKNGWRRAYSLQPGLNTITAPNYSNMKPAVIYIENGALPNEQAYAPRVRLIGGTAFPVYYHGKTDPTEFKRELEAYVANISVDDNDFAVGVPNNVVYNVAELISENNTISTSAAGALKGIQEMESIGKTVSDTMDEWETMWREFQKVSGNFEVDLDPTKFYTAKFTSRVFTKGPYGWSDWGYTGYNGGNSPRRDDGFFKQIVKPFSAPGNDGWAYFHEWGHNINNSAMEHVEITNNIHSVIMRKLFQNSNNDRVNWTELYKRFSGENVSHGYWTYLGILEQIQYYYGQDSYGKATQISIKNPDGVMNGLGSNLQRLVVGLSLATETDLTTFFEDWGYVTATDTMKKKVEHLPKPAVKLEYMNSLGRDYKGAGFSEDAKVNIKSVVVNKGNNTISLSYQMDALNQEAAMGYEIIRDGQVVGYTTSTSFVDKNIDPNVNYIYEIVAYDKKLNVSKLSEVKSFKPTISIEDQLTLKLNQQFNPIDFVKAVDYQGNDITEEVTVNSNVDVTKKGNYELVYSVNNNGVTETKTTQVTVVSDFEYVSDISPVVANIGWGGYKIDKSPSGGTIGLIRQGLETTYAKGIGAHARSEITYNIEGKGFDFFESYIGIDQAVKGNSNSSAKFEVWVDGEIHYESDVFGSNTGSEFVRVPVTGAKEIKLVTTDAGTNGNSADHTVWADAKFTKSSSAPIITVTSEATKVGQPIDIKGQYVAIDAEDGDLTSQVVVTGIEKVNFNKAGKYELFYTVTDSDGNTVSETRTIAVVNMEDYNYLSNFDWTSTQNSYAAPKKDVATSGNSLRLTADDGSQVIYEKGIGAHSNSTIVYDLTDKDAAYFTSYVGVDRQMYNTVGSVVFQVYVDGVKQFDSGLMTSKVPQQFVEVNLSGAKELKLVVTDGGNGNGSDHATWGDAKFHNANADRVYTGDLETVLVAVEAIITENYSETSVQALQTAIAKAKEVLANKMATQTEVDGALAALENAKTNLEEIDLNQVVTIKDPSIRNAIKTTLGLQGDITLSDMYKLTSLTSESQRVRSLEGLEYAKNLETLNVIGNEITDFSPLKELSKLTNWHADQQYVEMGEIKGPVVDVENIVIGKDGKKVRPYAVGYSHTLNNEAKEIDVNALDENPETFKIDLTNEDDGLYWLGLSFKIEENTVMLRYLINNK